MQRLVVNIVNDVTWLLVFVGAYLMECAMKGETE